MTASLGQKAGGAWACLYMPQDGHWLASIEVIPPPTAPQKKWALPRQIFFPPLKFGTVVSDLKFVKFWATMACCFPAKKMSRHSRLSRTTSGLSRLIRPRPIDCDRVSEKRKAGEDFPGFWPFFCSNIVKKEYFYRIPALVTIYTPKEAHSRIFVTGGSVFARQKGYTHKKLFLGRLACILL